MALRLEHLALPTGPSIVGMVASAAFYIGLAQWLSLAGESPEQKLSIELARQKFYAAARFGLSAQLRWFDGEVFNAPKRLSSRLLPMAREGPQSFNIAEHCIDHLLNVIAARIKTGQTGAQWQRNLAARHSAVDNELTRAYRQAQGTGRPVHEWPS